MLDYRADFGLLFSTHGKKSKPDVGIWNCKKQLLKNRFQVRVNELHIQSFLCKDFSKNSVST
ncbi:MAG: hypothetical protein H7A23_15315 [Leptospiraceae bacterium]|nr:hypothetical protein [Leptospiraceae bacterium]